MGNITAKVWFRLVAYHFDLFLRDLVRTGRRADVGEAGGASSLSVRGGLADLERGGGAERMSCDFTLGGTAQRETELLILPQGHTKRKVLIKKCNQKIGKSLETM